MLNYSTHQCSSDKRKLFTTGNVSITFDTTTGVLAKTITGNTGSDGDLEAGEIIVIEFNASIN